MSLPYLEVRAQGLAGLVTVSGGYPVEAARNHNSSGCLRARRRAAECDDSCNPIQTLKTRRHPEATRFIQRGEGSQSLVARRVGNTPLPLLTKSHRQISLRLRHLAPQLCQIGLHRGILRLFSQCQSKPPVSRRQIARRAKPGGVERTKRNHRLRIRLLRRRTKYLQSAVAILLHALAVDISFSLGDAVGWLCRRRLLDGFGLRNWRRFRRCFVA